MTHTREQILSMTDEELREAIAKQHGLKGCPTNMGEALEFGWRRLSSGWLDYGSDFKEFYEGEPGSVIFVPPFGWKYLRDFPDYPHDIAAAFELEGEITNPLDRIAYKDFLATYGKGADTNFTRWNLIHASPRDRSCAWLIWHEGAK